MLVVKLEDANNFSKTIEEQKENKRAIVVGINKYEATDNITELSGAENDAKEIYKNLTTINGFKIANEHFLLGERAKQKNINRTISELFRKNTDNTVSLILFYFSGHGFTDEQNKRGYIAPYDMDPDDPEFCGIKMEDLRNAAFESKNKANVLIILDCCYAGIVTRETKKGNYAQAKNVYATAVQAPFPSDGGKSRFLLASSEASAESREKNDCQDLDNTELHSHGAFSFHLIEGLQGKGANPDTGIITFESLLKYLENQVVADGKQRPLWSRFDESSRLDKIRIGISPDQYNNKIKELVKSADLYSRVDGLKIPDLWHFRAAARNVKELADLDNNNKEIPRLIQSINQGLQKLQEQAPIYDWLARNGQKQFIPMTINQICDGLYDDIFYSLAGSMSYEQLCNMDDTNFQYLIALYTEAKKNTTYISENDQRFKILIGRLRATSPRFNL